MESEFLWLAYQYQTHDVLRVSWVNRDPTMSFAHNQSHSCSDHWMHRGRWKRQIKLRWSSNGRKKKGWCIHVEFRVDVHGKGFWYWSHCVFSCFLRQLKSTCDYRSLVMGQFSTLSCLSHGKHIYKYISLWRYFYRRRIYGRTSLAWRSTNVFSSACL